MIDDGKSAKEIYRVDNFDLVEVPEEDYGKFYSGDCYVVLYAYTANNRDNYIIYFWLVCFNPILYVLQLKLLPIADIYIIGLGLIICFWGTRKSFLLLSKSFHRPPENKLSDVNKTYSD